MLRFKVDENLPRDVAETLIGGGHDAVTVPQQNMGGATDIIVADVCRQEGRLS
jgi:predicted nuclease of predicted toxin-antitoxin system